MTQRPLFELINTQEPGWALISDWLGQATNVVQVLPKIQEQAESILLAAQVTTRSPLGAIIYETGGLLIDHGWLRLLGSGSSALNRNPISWSEDKLAGVLLIADDILGGFFALNAGAFGTESLGQIYYFAPESLEWQPLDKSYSDFLFFCFSGSLSSFYDGLRWAGWEQEVTTTNGSQGFMCYPFLFTAEGKNLHNVRRDVVPIEQLWSFGQDMQRQLDR